MVTRGREREWKGIVPMVTRGKKGFRLTVSKSQKSSASSSTLQFSDFSSP